MDGRIAALRQTRRRPGVARLRIGRPAEHGLHELVISRGNTGNVALYRYLEASHIVLVLALRHQGEAGYDASIE